MSFLDLTEVICQEINDNSNDKLCNKQICTVCDIEDNGNYKCTCFSTSCLENEMVQNFIICGKYNGILNEIFECCWDHQIKLNISATTDVSYNSIYELVWKPTISQCQSLLCKLQDKTISLNEVESLYQIENFSLQLSALCDAMHKCYPSFKESLPPPHEWVPHTLSHIVIYHEIANNPQCTKAARIILQVRASLKLKGDFKTIEDLAKHVRMFV